jgi:hypothetical protein
MTYTHEKNLRAGGLNHGWRRRRYVALAGAGALVALAACKDSAVPFYAAPTSIPGTPGGVTQAITGLFAATRDDQFQVALELSAYAREVANFTATEPRFIEYDTGIIPIPIGAWIETWAVEYQNIRSAQEILAALPKTVPAYTDVQAAGITGVVQTIEALNYLILVWAHDSEGIAITQSPTETSIPPAVCLKDALTYIVALLDSANTSLNTAGATAIPIKIPPGFKAVGQFAGPSTAPGSFASFNRALAAKAGLELAYAIAHQNGHAPDLTTGGTPDIPALTRADSAAKASALFQPLSLPQNSAGGWLYDQFSVLYDFAGVSGDQANPMNGITGTQAVLGEVPATQDTINDLRWKAKFVLNPAYSPGGAWPVQQPSYSQAHAPGSPTMASVYIYGMYPSPSSPMPIIRSETLTLIEAQIRLGLGDFAGALALINDVRTEVGGVAPSAASTYPALRNQILQEQQISTLMEGGADRVISIRMYSVAALVDTTWKDTGPPALNGDAHTTVTPLTAEELNGRNGTWAPTCQ